MGMAWSYAKVKGRRKNQPQPVILLTAKQTDDNKIEGYSTGADADMFQNLLIQLC